MKYILDKKWFKENGSDNIVITRAGRKHPVEVTPETRMSEKFMDMLFEMKKPYIYLTDESPVKKVAPKKKSKKVKIDEPKSAEKEELQEEVSTETNEEGE